MQTSHLPPCSLTGKEDGDSSQKTAQSKSFTSLLVPASTGMMPESLQGMDAGFHAYYDAPAGENCAAVGNAISSQDASYAGRCYATKDTSVLHGKKTSGCSQAGHRPRSFWVWPLYGLCLVTVMLCVCLVVPGVCVYHHQQQMQQQMQQHMRKQNHSVQTLLKDYHSLSEKYDSLHDDFQNLGTEFDKYRLQNKMTVKTAEDQNPLENARTDQSEPSMNALLQLIRSNGLSQIPKRAPVKRSTRCDCPYVDENHVESIVYNYLRRMPKVHLRGLSNVSSNSDYYMNKYMVWQDSGSFRHRGVTLKYVHHQHNRVKGIEILETGVYMVYSQVVVNGSQNDTWRRDCAHQTVLLPYSDNMDHNPRPQVLLSAFVTQDAEGYYHNDSVPYPRDTSLQVGIFRLIRQSQVRVQVPTHDDCRRTIFTTDPNASYFGLYQIA